MNIMPYPRFRISMTLREACRSFATSLVPRDPRTPSRFAAAFQRSGGYEHVILTGSGRGGFRLLLECGDFPPGSEIIFPAYTFHVMPVVAAECGLRPVFADVDPDTWNLTPESVRSRITNRTKAVVPTHLFGVPAEMEEISLIARDHGLMVVEDCAHALGSDYKGKAVGTLGDAALFTFAMSKNMPCWGGGAIVVKNHRLAEEMHSRVENGKVPSPFSVLRRQLSNIPGILFTEAGVFPWTLYPAIRIADLLGNDYFDRPFFEEVSPPRIVQSDTRSSESKVYRSVAHKAGVVGIAPFQATVGLRQLKRFPGCLEKQVENARYLRQRLEDCSGLQLQKEPSGTRSSFLYVRTRVNDPATSRRALLRKGIDTKPDDMRNCAALGIFGEQPLCPVAENLGGRCIELPCSHFYSRRQMDKIADLIIAALR